MCTFTVAVQKRVRVWCLGFFELGTVYLPHRLGLLVVNSTLNMPSLRLSHAKGKKGEEVGKLLRRQIPPLFDALMLIHSERTSCLPAYTVFLLCFSLSPGSFLFTPPAFSFLHRFVFCPALMPFLSLSFYQFTLFPLLCPLASHRHHCASPSTCNIKLWDVNFRYKTEARCW